MNLLDQRPDSPEWRADALARSGHSKLAAEGFLPTCHPDQLPEARSGDPCAGICREMLGDFAPALLLLDALQRRRVQALAALARALDDCAREQGTEGQRLAALNRWEFALESALEGTPTQHPAFAAMASAEALQPWSRAALAALFADARKRAARAGSDRGAGGGARPSPESLPAALAEALFGAPPSPRLIALAAALINDSAPTEGDRGRPNGSVSETAVADGDAIDDAPAAWRPALRYALLAARAHHAAQREPGSTLNLSAGARLVLLVRARWGTRLR